eukprot:scaffold23191_cov27-Tisochrysis_lutea.AAC.2
MRLSGGCSPASAKLAPMPGNSVRPVGSSSIQDALVQIYAGSGSAKVRTRKQDGGRPTEWVQHEGARLHVSEVGHHKSEVGRQGCAPDERAAGQRVSVQQRRSALGHPEAHIKVSWFTRLVLSCRVSPLGACGRTAGERKSAIHLLVGTSCARWKALREPPRRGGRRSRAAASP